MGKIMAGSSTKIVFILLVTFAITIPCLEAAHVLSPAEFDDVVKARAEEAHKVALDTYVPIPEGVAHDLNVAVHMYVSLYVHV
jgi:pectate lyase